MNTNLPRILCIDDEPEVLSSLERCLRKDFEVITLHSPVKALEWIKNNQDCSIVLSDYRMPKMNGVDLLKQIKLLAPNTIRAILSGQIDVEQMTEAINKAQIHRFILKPWDNEFLRIQMHEALLAHQTLAEKNHLKMLSITDPLTQLTNHRYFQESLRKNLMECQSNESSLALLMIDVDHFKSYNDRYGHPEGDRLLALVGHRIKAMFENKGITSRYGGEEFSVILPKLSLQKAQAISDELRLSFEKEAFPGPLGRPAFITISIGVAAFPDHAKKAAQLINIADQALYKAKHQGRNLTIVGESS